MYYAFSITKTEEGYKGEIYAFSCFTPTQMIIDGDVTLDNADNFNEIYSIIHPIEYSDDKLDVLQKIVKQVENALNPLSFWGCVFENGKYSEELTMNLAGGNVALILPDLRKSNE